MILVQIPQWFIKTFNYTSNGTTIWPFVFYVDEKKLEDEEFIRHEKIHLQQQREMLIIFFYIWYGIENLYWRMKGYKGKWARFRISFEKEAYYNEHDPDYLKTRVPYSWANYYKKPPHNHQH